ncbi:hypothetical protein [Actinomadura rugatobispora]|uniref:PH domain-containing protein n=1 Tax=Actinomadura rugatobispora TaxID=1994 RepID=A0ABW1A3B5_9ACTN|nr:hypothetical protein GCM10010200_062270 [Actinomadura rugatobispora]
MEDPSLPSPGPDALFEGHEATRGTPRPPSTPSTPTPPPSPGAEPGTVQFRPPPATTGERAALAAAILLGAVLCALILASGATGPLWAAAPYCLAALTPSAALALLLLSRRGATLAGPEGIVNRGFWTTSRIPWHEMTGFEVRATRSGRSVVVLRRHAGSVTLAAPVEGALSRDGSFGERLQVLRALAAAYRHAPPGLRERTSGRTRRKTVLLTLLAFVPLPLAAWSPWLDSWWPGRGEALSVPDPCALAGPELGQGAWRVPAAGSAGPGGPWKRTGHPGARRCQREQAGRGRLFMEVEVHQRRYLESASGRAASWMAYERGGPGAYRPVGDPHVRQGVEAQAKPGPGDTLLMARRANVVLTMQWVHGGAAGSDRGVAELARIAQAALGRVALG